MENIDYIELMLADFSVYKIDKSNILECNCQVENDNIDIDNDDMLNIFLVESLLLVVDDYTKILNYDSEDDFDVTKKNISQIAIYYDDGAIQTAYVDMSDYDTNSHQKNYLQDNTLYITIEN